MTIGCPHCVEARRQRTDIKAPELCCICYGARVIQQTWSLVWAWDYLGCDCQACTLLRKMRPFSVSGHTTHARPVMEPVPDDPAPMTCKTCGSVFVPWPEGLVLRLNECGPCYRVKVNARKTIYRRNRGVPARVPALLRRTA